MIREEIKSISSEPADLRKFGITVGMVLVIIGSLMFWFGTNGYIFLTAAGAFLVFSGIVFPPVLKPLNLAWMTLAVVLGFFMSRLILVILYYLILTPVSIVAKISGTRFIETGFKKDNPKTYWVYRDGSKSDTSVYERQF